MKVLPLILITFSFLTGCGSLNTQSVVSVYGTGTVMAQPDMVQMFISLAETAPTTMQAQAEVNNKVKEALQILKEAEIEDKNISTASLRFSPDYDWGLGRTLLGQRAEQTISFTIHNIKDDSERISRLIDRLIKINGIELQQLNFSVRDSTALFVRSRELAYQKAHDKAAQYAELSGLKIIKALTISEESSPQIFSSNVMRNQSNVYMDTRAAGDSSSSVVPSGELEITTTITATFLVR
jgi:uncharacterized protein YggE